MCVSRDLANFWFQASAISSDGKSCSMVLGDKKFCSKFKIMTLLLSSRWKTIYKIINFEIDCKSDTNTM